MSLEISKNIDAELEGFYQLCYQQLATLQD